MKNQDIDVTALVKFGANDSDCLPLETCVCGKEFLSWDFILGVSRPDAIACPACGRKLYFSCAITVFEVSP